MGFFSGLSTGLSLGKNPKSSRVSRATEARIKNILGINQLDLMPAHAARAFELASDPKSTTSDFVAVIESDEALSARIVRVANSVYFYRGSQATDIEKAVANIGLDELRCLLTAAMLKSLLLGKGNARKQVWANAVATAVICRGLARRFPNMSIGEAFLAGLVHDVGKLVMLRRAPDLYEKVLNEVTISEKTFLAAEEEIYELNHVEVGQWVAETWHFPESVIAAIASHHNAWPKDPNTLKTTQDLGLLVHISDTMAHAGAIGHQSPLARLKKLHEAELCKCFPLLGVSFGEGMNLIQTFAGEFEKQYGLYQNEA